MYVDTRASVFVSENQIYFPVFSGHDVSILILAGHLVSVIHQKSRRGDGKHLAKGSARLGIAC